MVKQLLTYAYITNKATQTLTAAATAAVITFSSPLTNASFNVDVIDTGFRIKKAGKYKLTVSLNARSVTGAGAADVVGTFTIYKNGTALSNGQLTWQIIMIQDATELVTGAVSFVEVFDAFGGDTIEIYGSSTGADMRVNGRSLFIEQIEDN